MFFHSKNLKIPLTIQTILTIDAESLVHKTSKLFSQIYGYVLTNMLIFYFFAKQIFY